LCGLELHLLIAVLNFAIMLQFQFLKDDGLSAGHIASAWYIGSMTPPCSIQIFGTRSW
jgi:hypothetical protein